MTQSYNGEGNTVQVIARGERSRAEEALHERESWFSNLLGVLPAAIYTTDAAGRITYFNEAAVELGAAGRSWAPASGAGPGSCTGRTARRCRTTNARWRSP